MDKSSSSRQSELFMVRLWPEEQGDGSVAWRGRVQHAISGRSAYFQGWPALAAVLDDFLAEQAHQAQTTGEI
jgi:hypothetical protein